MKVYSISSPICSSKNSESKVKNDLDLSNCCENISFEAKRYPWQPSLWERFKKGCKETVVETKDLIVDMKDSVVDFWKSPPREIDMTDEEIEKQRWHDNVL